MDKETKIKITPAKGHPILHWVDYVKGFPIQLIDVFDPSSIERRWKGGILRE